MRLNKFLAIYSISSSLILSPAVSQAKNNISSEVFQLVGKTLISTNQKSIKRIKFYDCKLVNGYKIYFSTKKNIIGSSNFEEISNEKIEEIKSYPQCKIMKKLIKN